MAAADDCAPPTPQMIAEGYAVQSDPTPAQRAAYASRGPDDDSPRPHWRFNEHWRLDPTAIEMSDDFGEMVEGRQIGDGSF